MRPYLPMLAMSCLLPSVAAARPETTTYRTQTLLVDGAALGFMVGGGLLEPSGQSEAIMALGLLGSVLGTPFVHGLRGHSDRFMGSLGIRLGLMTAGTFTALALRDDCDDPTNDSGTFIAPDIGCELEYLGYGILGAAVVATVIDAALFTDEAVEKPTWTPHLVPTGDGVRAGVSMAF